jgi:hypothetical protein
MHGIGISLYSISTYEGQTDTKALHNAKNFCSEKEKICITHAKFEKITHEYSTIVGIDSRINT